MNLNNFKLPHLGISHLVAAWTVLFGAVVAGAELDRSDAIAEMRKLSEQMVKSHFSTSAKERSRRFLRWTEPRVWRDRSGKFSTTATYVGHDKVATGVEVSLKKTTGEVIRVNLAQLSAADELIVQELANIIGQLRKDGIAFRDFLVARVERGDLRLDKANKARTARAANAVPTLIGGDARLAYLGLNPYGSVVGLDPYTLTPLPAYTSYYNGYPYNTYGWSSYGNVIGYPYGYSYGYPNVRWYGSRYGRNWGRPHGHPHGHGHHNHGQYNPAPPNVPSGGSTLRRGPRSPLTGGDAYGY